METDDEVNAASQVLGSDTMAEKVMLQDVLLFTVSVCAFIWQEQTISDAAKMIFFIIVFFKIERVFIRNKIIELAQGFVALLVNGAKFSVIV
jgi:hypothetical protein